MSGGLSVGMAGGTFGWDVCWPFALAFLSIILVTGKGGKR
jgi:hypothetical protein